ncbi:MAG: hypothetical protein MUW56_22325 [Chryseobacterium sp.]|uniref:hypothetical protein n=1 Tax=Chryseobacterium sp. TaxID=1871047 RepID=UPI0025C1E187|nr:hypothetical protein [Chryseobacterium sp.]MCJ7936291.1 hypothetical protein [Chryseobacterium sp.]
MKKVNDMAITWKNDVFTIDGKAFEGVPATPEEIDELKKAGIEDNEPCGRQICYQGWVWVLIDAPSGYGCQWYKTNAQCNE